MEPFDNPETITWCSYVHKSYRHWLNKNLVEGDLEGKKLAKALYEANYVILAHEFEHEFKDVPRFVFANESAKMLWGYSWDEFIGMPSTTHTRSKTCGKMTETFPTCFHTGEAP